MGRVTEYIYYLNNDLSKEFIKKHFSYLTITDKIEQKRRELFGKNREKRTSDSLTTEEK